MYKHPPNVYSYQRNLVITVIERTFNMHAHILYISLSLRIHYCPYNLLFLTILIKCFWRIHCELFLVCPKCVPGKSLMFSRHIEIQIRFHSAESRIFGSNPCGYSNLVSLENLLFRSLARCSKHKFNGKVIAFCLKNRWVMTIKFVSVSQSMPRFHRGMVCSLIQCPVLLWLLLVQFRGRCTWAQPSLCPSWTGILRSFAGVKGVGVLE